MANGIHGYHPATRIIVNKQVKTISWCVANFTDSTMQLIFNQLDTIEQIDCVECGCSMLKRMDNHNFKQYKCGCGHWITIDKSINWE